MQLVSWENPDGAITELDLKLAGVLGRNMVLLQLTDLAKTTTTTGTDNTPAQLWFLKQTFLSMGLSSYLCGCRQCISRRITTSCKCSLCQAMLTGCRRIALTCGILPIMILLLISMLVTRRQGHGKSTIWIPRQARTLSLRCHVIDSCCQKSSAGSKKTSGVPVVANLLQQLQPMSHAQRPQGPFTIPCLLRLWILMRRPGTGTYLPQVTDYGRGYSIHWANARRLGPLQSILTVQGHNYGVTIKNTTLKLHIYH